MKRPPLQSQIDALVGRVAALEPPPAHEPVVGRVKLADHTVQFPNAPTGGVADPTGLPANVMPPVPPEYAVGVTVRRIGLSADQTTVIEAVSPTQIYVEMADGDERKTMWAPWSLYELA